jgi:hypothetical protein
MTQGKFVRAAATTDHGQEITRLIECVQQVLVREINESPNSDQAMSFALTALPTYAGIIFASMLVNGAAEPAQQAKMVKSMGHNFREGVKIGLRRAERLVRQNGAGGGLQ